MEIFSNQMKFFEHLQQNFKIIVKLMDSKKQIINSIYLGGIEKNLLMILGKPGKNVGGYGWFALWEVSVREGPL